MARLFTQEDIDRMEAMNKDMTGVEVGSLMLPREEVDLGYGPETEDPAPAVDATPVAATTPVAETTPVVTTPATDPATDPATSGAATLQQLLAAQAAPATPTDPYANLSKQQRQMLAFSALSDAGASLAGRKGGSFDAMMGRFNEQADMQRKATAAQAQRQMMQRLIGPGGAGDGSIEAQIEMLTNTAIAYPDMAPGLAMKIKALQEKLLQQKRDAGKGQAAAAQLRDVNDIIRMIDEDPGMTTGIWAMFTRGYAMTPAGKTQALINSVQSTLALDSLKELKATGATMGALNQQELNILKQELVTIDLAQGAEFTKRQLSKIQERYQRVLSDLYAGANEEDTAKINNYLGLETKPSWAGGSSQPSGTQREDETLEEFKKRMGL